MTEIYGARRPSMKDRQSSASATVPRDKQFKSKVDTPVDKPLEEHAKDAADLSLKAAAVAVIGAVWKDKALRKKLLRSVTKKKVMKNGGKAVVHALLEMKVLRKKELKKIAGRKLAKKLVA